MKNQTEEMMRHRRRIGHNHLILYVCLIQFAIVAVPIVEGAVTSHQHTHASTVLQEYRGGTETVGSIGVVSYHRDITPEGTKDAGYGISTELINTVDVQNLSSVESPSSHNQDNNEKTLKDNEGNNLDVIMSILIPLMSTVFVSMCIAKVYCLARDDFRDEVNTTADSLQIDQTRPNARNLREILITVTYQRRAVLENFFSDAMPFSTVKTEDQDKTSHTDVQDPNKSNHTSCNDGSNHSEHDIENPKDITCPNTPDTIASIDDCYGDNFQDNRQELEGELHNSSTNESRRELFHTSVDSSNSSSLFLVPPEIAGISSDQGVRDKSTDAALTCRPVTLPVEAKQQYSEEVEDEEDKVCPICLDECDEGDEEIIQSKHCSHIFHKDCIFDWLEKHSDCPVCREHMITTEEVHAAAAILIENRKNDTMINRISKRLGISLTQRPATPPPSQQQQLSPPPSPNSIQQNEVSISSNVISDE